MPRKPKTYHYVYRTTNIVTNKFYIGIHSTDDLNDGYLGSGKRLKYSLTKYGKENHTMKILEFCSDRQALYAREKEIVNNSLLEDQKCLNLKVGGEGAILVGDKNGMFGRKHSEEHKLKISEKLKGKPGTNNRPIVVNGKEYPSLDAAALETGIKRTTIGKRILSKKFMDTYYKDFPKE